MLFTLWLLLCCFENQSKIRMECATQQFTYNFSIYKEKQLKIRWNRQTAKHARRQASRQANRLWKIPFNWHFDNDLENAHKLNYCTQYGDCVAQVVRFIWHGNNKNKHTVQMVFATCRCHASHTSFFEHKKSREELCAMLTSPCISLQSFKMRWTKFEYAHSHSHSHANLQIQPEKRSNWIGKKSKRITRM